MTAFDISQEYLILEKFANEINEETGEYINDDEDIRSLMEEMDGKKSEKIERIEYVIREKKGQQATVKEEEKRCQARGKRLGNDINRLTKLELFLLNGEKLKTDKFTFSFRKSKSLIVPDKVDQDSTSEWVRTIYAWDKKKIREDIETSGIDYTDEGFEIVSKTSLSVR